MGYYFVFSHSIPVSSIETNHEVVSPTIITELSGTLFFTLIFSLVMFLQYLNIL